MDFSFTEEQTLLRNSVERFIQDKYDIETRRKIVNSEEGMSREDAYDIVQSAAMKTWKGTNTFRENLLHLKSDAQALKPENLDKIMDYKNFLTHLDAIYQQCGVV